MKKFRKISGALIAAGILTTSLPVYSAAAAVGDLNGDGAIDEKDAGLFAQYFAGWTMDEEAKEGILASGDVNGDEEVTRADAMELARSVGGWGEYADSDSDGIKNGEELSFGTSPYLSDTDYDGLTDYDELYVYETNPLKEDTDGDSLIDSIELSLGLNPTEANSDGETSDAERIFEKTLTDKDSVFELSISGIPTVVADAGLQVEEDYIEDTTGHISPIINVFKASDSPDFDKAQLCFDYSGIENVDETSISWYYMNDDTMTYEKLYSQIDSEKKIITAELDHFSKYVVAESNVITDKATYKPHENPNVKKINYNGSVISVKTLYDTGFDLSKNSFAFRNFSTDDNKSGLCFGITYTTHFYHSGRLPVKTEGYDLSDVDNFLYNSLYDTADKELDQKLRFYEKYNALSMSQLENDDYLVDIYITFNGNKYYNVTTSDIGTYYYINKDIHQEICDAGGKIVYTNKKTTDNSTVAIEYVPRLEFTNENFINSSAFSENQKETLKCIEYWHNTQNEYINGIVTHLGINSITESHNFDELIYKLKKGETVPLGLCVAENWLLPFSDMKGHHAVLACGIYTSVWNPNEYYISVYDCNYPGEYKYIKLIYHPHESSLTNNWYFPEYLVQDYVDKGIYYNTFFMLPSVDPGDGPFITPTEPTTLASGTCGNNATWTLSSDGTLTISGTGDMTNYGYGTNSVAPWTDYNDSIKNVIINSGITKIGTHSLKNCTNLVYVSIPESVLYIGEYAFSGCTNLQTIDFSEGLLGIYKYAFQYCTSLETIDLPDSITSLAPDAFYQCTALYEVGYPASWKTVLSSGGEYDEGNHTPFYRCTSLKQIIVDEGVTSIPKYAFRYLNSLETVILPDSLTIISGFAFDGCNKLTTPNIPENLMTISNSAFYNCKKFDHVILPKKLELLQTRVFAYCTNLETIYLPKSLLFIDSDTFYDCDNLTIYCYKDSYGHQYAIKNNIKYVIVEE